MALIEPNDDGLADLLVDDIDLDADFTWTPKAQPVPTITAHRHPPSRRRQEDHRNRGLLAGVLTPLPTAGETIHIILPGNVALGDVVWSMVDGTQLPGPLHVSTLGFGRAWIAGLAGGLAPSTGEVRIQRFTVSGWTPIFWANSRWLSPESRNSRTS